jgi:hypothetical protein
MRALRLLFLVSLLAWSAAARTADENAQQLQELTVTGERTGPGMWHVHKGSSQLWVLGSLSPLPRGITWRATEVDRVLGTTTQVLVQKPLDIGVVRINWILINERSVIMIEWG